MSGAFRSSSKMKVAYFAQHQLDELKEGGTPFSHVRELMPDAPEAKVRSRAAQMGFPGQKADTPVSNISGGEKARLLMGLATFGGPHLLILDEPTNHLDIDSRVALMDAINEYEGAIILISHDRFLLEACADRLWLVNSGTVKPFDGDLDAYRALVLEGPEALASVKSKQERMEAAAREAPVKKVHPNTIRKKIETVDARIAKISELINRVDEILSKPETFQRDKGKAAQLSAQRAELAKALETAEEEWLALSTELEEAS